MSFIFLQPSQIALEIVLKKLPDSNFIHNLQGGEKVPGQIELTIFQLW